MKLDDIKYIYDNPLALLADLPQGELAELQWFVKLLGEDYHNRGYFINNNTWHSLNFPDSSMFALESDHDKDIAGLYKNFAWRGFLKYCQPLIDDSGELQGFAYRGNMLLDDEVARYMLRFPSADWLDSTLLRSNIKISPEMRDFIEENKTTWTRSICAEFKQSQSRLYALLYLLDTFPFVVRSFTDRFESTVECYTRSTGILRSFVPEQADELISFLENDDTFDMPFSGIISCVRLQATKTGASSVSYIADIVELNTNEPYVQFLPFFAFKAYVDGFSDRLNDMPNRAAQLTLDLPNDGVTQRYCTLSKDVFKSICAETDLMQMSSYSRIRCGLDYCDFDFRYLNLQLGLKPDPSFYTFSPFALHEVQNFSLQELSNTLQYINYTALVDAFKAVIATENNVKLASLAEACGIDPNKSNLSGVLSGFIMNKNPAELLRIYKSHTSLFK